VICPNCGENNSANFRYCGMCGTSLEPRRPAGAPRTVSSDAQRTLQSPATFEDNAKAQGTGPTTGVIHEPPPTAGPSFLGLNQPFTESGAERRSSGSTSESFSSLDSFFEPEEPGVSVRGIVLVLLLLAGLGAGGWWAYTHYNGPGTTASAPKPTAAQPETSNAPSNPPAAERPSSPTTNSPSEVSSSPSAPPATASTPPPTEAERLSPPPTVEAKPERSSPPPKSAEGARPKEKVARGATKASPRPSPAAAVSSDKGDAEFKRGEAYLYGRGLPENCYEAIKNLKNASSKQNAKARSTFGTMYATGHCVPRDLPTSYSWFAQALRVDPNNQILEKDLTAVWNQMTPPERQMAAKSKP